MRAKVFRSLSSKASSATGDDDGITYKTKTPTSVPTTASVGTQLSLGSFSTDDYIVYSTVLVFAVVILVCSVMWCARPPRRAKLANGADLEGGNGSKMRPKTPSSDTKKSKSSSSASGSASGGGNKKKSSLRKTNKSSNKDEAIDEDQQNETGSMISEASSLLGGDVVMALSSAGNGHGLRNVALAGASGAGAGAGAGAGGTASRPARGFKDLSPQDEALRKTFHSVLKEGMTMVLHTTDKQPKQIHLTLVGTELRWKAAKVFARNQYKIDLRDIKYVEWGKQTNTFQKQLSSNVADDMCFSLITDKVTVDLEASSKVERDALVQGFSLVVSGLRESSSI